MRSVRKQILSPVNQIFDQVTDQVCDTLRRHVENYMGFQPGNQVWNQVCIKTMDRVNHIKSKSQI
jgi:hypothetical protein